MTYLQIYIQFRRENVPKQVFGHLKSNKTGCYSQLNNKTIIRSNLMKKLNKTEREKNKQRVLK